MTEQTLFIEDVPSHAHELIQAVFGTVVSLAVVAAVGTWLLVHQGADGSPATAGAEGRSRAALAAQASGGSARSNPAPPSAGDDAPRSGPTTAPDGLSAKTLYIVASQEQADTVRARLAEANAIRDMLGQPPLDERVVQFVSDEEEALFWLARSEEDTLRGGAGLPTLRLVDLRGQDH